MSAKRNNIILRREDTLLLVIDVQERILKVIRGYEQMTGNILKLIRGCRTLGVPIVYTEQYPKGLGPTVEEIKNELKGSEAVEKMSFSCYGAGLRADEYSTVAEDEKEGDLFAHLRSKNIKQIVVCGIESHVCVQQTVLDLLANGYQVNVAADAVSSRKRTDYDVALRRMEINGAQVTTTESVLFELLNVCGTGEFKTISRLVK